MSTICRDTAGVPEHMQVFVPGVRECDSLKYRFTKGIAAIRFVDGVCHIVLYQEQVSLDGSPPTNVATHVALITPTDLLRSAYCAIDFVLSLGAAAVVRAITNVPRWVH